MFEPPILPPAGPEPATGPEPAPGAAGSGPALLPVLLKLDKFRVLIVGEGEAAREKLAAILDLSPATAVTVVGTPLLPGLQELAARYPNVRLVARPFVDSDLLDQDLIFIATENAALRHYVKAAAAVRHQLTNVADAPEEGDFRLAATEPPDAALRPQTAPVRPAYPAAVESSDTIYWRRIATGSLVLFALFISLNILSYYVTWPQVYELLRTSNTFYIFVAVGFVAQLVDGLLGMGYGAVTAISLMSMGLAPAAVSASIHTAEMFASGVSGYHHYKFGNVNRRLFKALLLPGVVGAVSGALLLSYYGERYAQWVKPLLAVYLLVLGLRILTRAFSRIERRHKIRHVGWLAGAGGFLDSFGGGGWGPLVTSTLIAKGRTPQYVIGSVSLTEFFVTFASAFTFFSVLGISHWQIVLGLIVGGVAAAPIAARLAGRIPMRGMFAGVGLVVIFWSLWSLWKAFS
jgi:uncharacterized membrane protein YfcA